MVECTSINPEILVWAREVAGYSVEEIASITTYKDIVLWEKGEKYPTYKKLKGLSSKYKLPVVVFFFPEPPQGINKEIQKEKFRTIPEFELNKLKPDTRKIIWKAQAIQLNLKEITNGVSQASRLITQDNVINVDIPTETNAIRLRDYLNITISEQKQWMDLDKAFENWRTLFANCGLFVFKDAFKDDNIAGFCLYDSAFPIIFVNNSLPKTRQIFTLFHELAHILVENNNIDLEEKAYLRSLDNQHKKMEVFCNKFAGDFLVPIQNLSEDINNIDISEATIEKIANEYSVSREVILRKLFDNNKVSQDYYDQMSEKWKKQAIEAKQNKPKSGGDYYNTQVTYLGMNYIGLVFQKYNQNLISFDKALECLNINAKSFSGLEERFMKKVILS